jgi:hypothetical protein
MSAKAVRAPEPRGPITKADIEAKLREATGELDDEVEHGRRFAPWLLAAGAVIVVVYRLGLRRGARHSTLLEIRRIPSA